ncbi:enoyl-CoA hydratase/isomerase family protein [Neobacillus niacini]|uniref:enoyl-CoA hydratase/isomerase family protein n=1 Tax=Neobacillus niacini TaxID=86668 RepID=UPI0009EDD68A|nr:enoyl-CoA hydratase/isomerase family protein [Neobacillus niacini]MEC1520462.1 enoyl-CoA hydratase/isomerase family protein [Neobacillus niacini]
MSQPIIVKIENGIGSIFLNRPKKLNSLSTDLVEDLTEALISLDKNPEVKVIVLSGEGKSYCAGGDLETIQQFTKQREIISYLDKAINVTRVILNMDKYVISAVHGFAAGAGFSLALASDFIVADSTAKFGLSFVNIGVIPDLGLIKLLSERVPTAIAKEWIVTGKILGVEEAETWGIVNKVVDGDLLQGASEFAQKIMNGPPLSNSYVKKMLNHTAQLPWEAFLEQETMVQANLIASEDMQEGVNAFLEKRAPKFTGV